MINELKTAPRFFSLEGIDGSGKTTQLDMLEQALCKEGFSVVRLREPGGSEISEKIRALLLDPIFKGKMADETELLLYNAARAQIITEVIKPALSAENIVLADRFCWSTFAYQGFGRYLGADYVHRLTEVTCGSFIPELTVVLDIDVQKSRVRTAKRGEAPDRLEQEKADFFERVREGYLTAAKRFSEHVVALDADKTPDEVHRELLALIKSRL